MKFKINYTLCISFSMQGYKLYQNVVFRKLIDFNFLQSSQFKCDYFVHVGCSCLNFSQSVNTSSIYYMIFLGYFHLCCSVYLYYFKATIKSYTFNKFTFFVLIVLKYYV